MGRSSRRRKDSDIKGLLLVDKPAGMTSHDVVGVVRRLAKTRRVGHTGTLDPDATGLLPLTLGACTKLANFLILDQKVYRFRLELGSQTSTDDASGEVLHTGDASHVTHEMLDAALDAYRGDILQRPPRFSAIRIDGKRAHELARAGVDFELDARPVHVARLDLLSFESPYAELEMLCSSGTYVRSVVRDVGADLGCYAHTTSIRRLQVGPFTIEDAVSLDTLRERVEAGEGEFPHDVLLSPAQMVASLPAVTLDEEMIAKLMMGQRVQGRLLSQAPVELDGQEDGEEKEIIASLLDAHGELLAVGQIIQRELASDEAKQGKDQLVEVAPKKVIIPVTT